MDFRLQTWVDGQFFYIGVAQVIIAFDNDDIGKVIDRLELVRDEIKEIRRTG